ncbi:Hypothetical protein NTJ_09187 [Nesidiocoris tenuis]|uniref:Gustatory receptor n=1 Tax=Nesidiocoris tenuis TaxID=355587 RepID=A0ABN7AZK4_9HEMI|nr:Hypothetical protein NTJ_09187 [Nesidiocoris tenuis]
MSADPKLPYDSNLMSSLRKIMLPYQLLGMFPFRFHNCGMKTSVFLAIYSIVALPAIIIIAFYWVGYIGQKDAILPAWIDIPSMLFPLFYLETHPFMFLINRNSVVKMMDRLNEVARRFLKDDTSTRYARFRYLEMTLTPMIFVVMATTQCVLIPLAPAKHVVSCAVLMQSGLVFTLLGGLLAMMASALHTLRIQIKRMGGISDFETAIRDYEKIADAAAYFEKICNVNCSTIIMKCFVETNMSIFYALEHDFTVLQLHLLVWASAQLWIIWRLICGSESVRDQVS